VKHGRCSTTCEPSPHREAHSICLVAGKSCTKFIFLEVRRACDEVNQNQKQNQKQENEQGVTMEDSLDIERSQVPIAERTPSELVNLIKKLRWIGLEEEAAQV